MSLSKLSTGAVRALCHAARLPVTPSVYLLLQLLQLLLEFLAALLGAQTRLSSLNDGASGVTTSAGAHLVLVLLNFAQPLGRGPGARHPGIELLECVLGAFLELALARLVNNFDSFLSDPLDNLLCVDGNIVLLTVVATSIKCDLIKVLEELPV